MSAATGKDAAVKIMRKKNKRRIREASRLVSFAFIAGSFAFCMYLTVASYGQSRYNQAVRDSYMMFQKFQSEQPNPCRKATIRELTLEKDPMYQ